METAEAKAVYRLRGQTIELVFADVKEHRGLRCFSGHGLVRVHTEFALEVLLHNLIVLLMGEGKSSVLIPTVKGTCEMKKVRDRAYLTFYFSVLLTLVSAFSSHAAMIDEPSLQLVTPTSITIVWRTDLSSPSDSRVQYGTHLGLLNWTATGTAFIPPSNFKVKNHVVTITGLYPNSQFFYNVGTTSGGVQGGGTAAYYFITAPEEGSSIQLPARIIDSSRKDSDDQIAVRDAILNDTESNPSDIILHGGTLANDSRTDSGLADQHLAIYKDMLRHAVIEPAVGNSVRQRPTKLFPWINNALTLSNVRFDSNIADSFSIAKSSFVSLTSSNLAPSADADSGQTVPLMHGATPDGTGSGEDLPTPFGAVRVQQWSQVSSPGTVTVNQASEDFTIVVLPDTQFYAEAGSPIFEMQTQWIVDNKDAMNIVYVAHVGDCVQNADLVAEWELADAAFSLIEDPSTTMLADGIPYGIAVGNHDQIPIGDPSPGSTALYNEFFGESRFDGRAYYGGHFGSDNDNSYEFFSASGLDFIVVYLEYDTSPDTAILDWADNLLKIHSDKRAIVVSHYIIGPGNPGSFGTQGLAIYNALKDNPNLFLMLGGHRTTEGRRTDTFDGNQVHSVLADYQTRPNGGDGWLRIMQFSPANNEIQVRTYSPWLGRFETDGSSQFTLSYNMTGTTSNEAPSADAGSDQTVTLAEGVTLNGTIGDDGLPTPPGALSVQWSQVSGPGTVTFDDAQAVDTTASFSEVGTYVLRLTADDGELTSTDEVTITVTAGGQPPASFAAYNDLAWRGGQLNTNITTITSPNGGSGLPSSGELLDLTTGAGTGVVLTVTGGTFNGTNHASSLSGSPASGTDAYEVFNGKLTALGSVAYEDLAPPSGNLVLTFTGLEPGQDYEVVFYAHRNNYGWSRAALVTLSGAESFVNTSSVATDNPQSGSGGALFTGPSDPSTRLPADNDRGYVARFTNIDPGTDGGVVLTISWDGTPGNEYQGKYANALLIKTIE
jgi:hypothetical protein